MMCLLCDGKNLPEEIEIVHIYGYRLFYVNNVKVDLCQRCMDGLSK